MRRKTTSKVTGRPRSRPITALGQRILSLTARRRMTLDGVATASGVNLTTLYRVISGAHDPKLSTLAAIAAALHVPVDRLVAGHVAAERTSA